MEHEQCVNEQTFQHLICKVCQKFSLVQLGNKLMLKIQIKLADQNFTQG